MAYYLDKTALLYKYGCKWAWVNIQCYNITQIRVRKQCIVFVLHLSYIISHNWHLFFCHYWTNKFPKWLYLIIFSNLDPEVLNANTFGKIGISGYSYSVYCSGTELDISLCNISNYTTGQCQNNSVAGLRCRKSCANLHKLLCVMYIIINLLDCIQKELL